MYAELRMAAKNEERRQSELIKRQQYAKTNVRSGGNNASRVQVSVVPRDQSTTTKTSRPPIRVQQQKRCYICNSPDHLANKCNVRKGESQGGNKNTQKRQSIAR